MKIKLLFNRHFWYDLKWKIHNFFFPKQEWLIDKIPDSWVDKTELIQLVLHEILVNFVEHETILDDQSGLDSIYSERYEDTESIEHYGTEGIEERKNIRKDLQECYDYIKTGRKELEDASYAAMPKPLNGKKWTDHFIPLGNGNSLLPPSEVIYGKSTEESYKETWRLDKLIEEKDQWVLHKIIEHRQSLWT